MITSILMSGGSGQITAAHYPLRGCQEVARFLIAIRRSPLIPALNPQIIQINKQPGILNTMEGNLQSTFGFEFSGQMIKSIQHDTTDVAIAILGQIITS
jgi:RNA polymerase sigma-70 factor, ECF subfamily